MKSKVLDRPMFKKKGGDIDPENVGIMQGFKDMLGDLEFDDMEMVEMDDAEKVSGRTPDSPEILMNNLRGDMRSIDARVEELADLVGYGPAMETPTQVLALLQPVLGSQEAMPATPPAMMPPPMPADQMAQAPMPMAQGPMPPGGIGSLGEPAPVAMRNGGIVQRFKDGSDEEGVTAQDANYPPELLERSRSEIMKFINQAPIAVPDLAAEAARREPLYRQIMGGGDRSMTQAQILFDIAQGALNVAAGTDAEGRQLRGPQSTATRLAAGLSKVPAMIGARAGELQKEERQVKLAALQGAEKAVSDIREQNAKMVESQRKIFSDVLKSSGASPFGKGDWEWGVINRPGLLSRWVEGKTTDAENNLIDSAITEFKNPIIENRVDPVTKEPYTVQRNRLIPPFLQQAIDAKAGKTTAPATTTPPATTAPGTPAPAGTPTSQLTPGQINLADSSQRGDMVLTSATAPAAVVGPTAKLPQRQIGLYGLAPKIAGPGAAMARIISGVPGLGDPFPEVTIAVKEGQLAVEDLIETSLKSRSGAINEQNRLRAIFGLGPRPFTDPELYKSEIVAIDNILAERLKKEERDAYDKELPPDVRGNARELVRKIIALREKFVLPPRIYSADDEVYKGLQPGQEYLWQGVYPMKKGAARGR